ncbi:MAG: radical SAM protein, partial [Vicinamibacteria bacterium]|nr:radical SAM protein [Vicinamibacteria bacterium]
MSGACESHAAPRKLNVATEGHLMAFGRRAIDERIPLNGSIAMTHRCHLRCVHCYLGEERYAPPQDGECDTAFWLDAIDQITAAGCLNLLITGGEPLVRRDFAQVYERAIRGGLLTSLFTNGTLIDPPLLDLLADLPPQMVEISLYGATAEVYERVTGAPGSYVQCMRGIDALVSRGIPSGLKAMILSENQAEIAAMRALALARGLPFRVDPAISPRLSGERAPLAHRISADQAVALEMEDEGLRARTAAYYRKTRGQPSEERLFPCLAGVTGFHIHPTGTLYPCLVVTTHGFDLRHGSFREGWNGIVSAFHEQELRAGYECPHCDLRFL